MYFRLLLWPAILVLSSGLAAYGADPPISLELVAEQGFPIEGQQQWIRFLQDRQFGFSGVRIRSARAGDEPAIDNRGSDLAPRYTVTGVLTSGRRLVLPGQAFRYGQRKELAQWLEKLRRGGAEAVTAPTGAFGLTARQLAKLRDGLKRPVVVATKGQPLRDVVRHVERMSNITLDTDAEAQRVLSGSSKVLDELQGLSCGSALAAAVRPYGLLVTPIGQGTRDVGLRITRSAKPEDAWPVGVAAKGGLADVAPVLMKFINVEVVDQPLDDTLDTIQQRLEIPFLYDHNALARHEVDLHQPVKLLRKKTYYMKIIEQLLYQKLLVARVRTDEAGSPFLWITSVKK
jgi:hypothetical protein